MKMFVCENVFGNVNKIESGALKAVVKKTLEASALHCFAINLRNLAIHSKPNRSRLSLKCSASIVTRWSMTEL